MTGIRIRLSTEMRAFYVDNFQSTIENSTPNGFAMMMTTYRAMVGILHGAVSKSSALFAGAKSFSTVSIVVSKLILTLVFTLGTARNSDSTTH